MLKLYKKAGLYGTGLPVPRWFLAKRKNNADRFVARFLLSFPLGWSLQGTGEPVPYGYVVYKVLTLTN